MSETEGAEVGEQEGARRKGVGAGKEDRACVRVASEGSLAFPLTSVLLQETC